MKSAVSKYIGAGILAIGVAVTPLALPASAQVGTGTDTQGDVYREEQNEGFDWGWLGLLGLIGLAGLAGRNRQENTAYRDPNVTGPSTGFRE